MANIHQVLSPHCCRLLALFYLTAYLVKTNDQEQYSICATKPPHHRPVVNGFELITSLPKFDVEIFRPWCTILHRYDHSSFAHVSILILAANFFPKLCFKLLGQGGLKKKEMKAVLAQVVSCCVCDIPKI